MIKKIIHLSDLHFGTEFPGIVPILTADIIAQQPDLILVSGDLTQRALTNQFRAARQFLESLNQFPIISVPGNHDISLHNPIERFLYPFLSYHKWITSTFPMTYTSDHISIYGLNSVTPYKSMSGYLKESQLNKAGDFFRAQPDKVIKIAMMHHNLIRSERHKIINDSQRIIDSFAKCGVNMVLCGHIHQACDETLKSPYLQHPLYVITAGTPISTRTTKPNSYNIITLNSDKFDLDVREFVTTNGVYTSTKVKTLIL